MVREEWEKGMPICTKELLILFQCHVIDSKDDEAINMFVDGKKNTIQKFIGWVLKKHKYSIHKNLYHRVSHWIGEENQKRML
jgi:ribosomal protein L19